MDQNSFEQIEQAMSEQGAAGAFDRLASALKEQKEWHNLFDSRMLRKKFELGLPLSRPASLQDVPEEHRRDVEETYRQAAREAGTGFLENGDLFNAWMYFKVIREPEKIAEALEKLPDEIKDYEQLDRTVHIALHEGVNPAKGIRLLLNGQGICNTISTLDQVLPQLEPAHRIACAKIMVQTLYREILEAVERHVQQRIPMLPPNQTLEKLMAGRDWLFDGGTYHADVSHLSSVVRFARSIEAPAEELDLAYQLSLYGSKLEKSLQYAGDPPFVDMYPAHMHFFNVLLNRHREAGLKYFSSQLEAEPDAHDKPIYAYVLVDLLIRCGQLEDAVKIAQLYLTNLSDDVNVSFDELCVEAKRLDILKKVRREQGNLVSFTSALVREKA